MNALAFLLGSRAFEIARANEPAPEIRDEPLPPMATTPATAAAWRRWRLARETERAIDASVPRRRGTVRRLGAIAR